MQCSRGHIRDSAECARWYVAVGDIGCVECTTRSTSAGGEILRREMLVFERGSRRAVLRLQQILRDSKLALPLLALIGQQCARSLFQIDMNHVKLAGQSHDKCLHVFYQLVEFFSCPMKRKAGKSGALSLYNFVPHVSSTRV